MSREGRKRAPLEWAENLQMGKQSKERSVKIFMCVCRESIKNKAPLCMLAKYLHAGSIDNIPQFLRLLPRVYVGASPKYKT